MDARWPPIVGERLPQASQAFGITEKLSAYCLNLDHEIGGAKAQAFLRVLEIGSADVEHLSEALRVGVLSAPIVEVRDNAPFGVLCEVPIPVTGLRGRKGRILAVTTAWELCHAGDAPRLVTAYIGG